jgi:hypothetical protein
MESSLPAEIFQHELEEANSFILELDTKLKEISENMESMSDRHNRILEICNITNLPDSPYDVQLEIDKIFFLPLICAIRTIIFNAEGYQNQQTWYPTLVRAYYVKQYLLNIYCLNHMKDASFPKFTLESMLQFVMDISPPIDIRESLRNDKVIDLFIRSQFRQRGLRHGKIDEKNHMRTIVYKEEYWEGTSTHYWKPIDQIAKLLPKFVHADVHREIYRIFTNSMPLVSDVVRMLLTSNCPDFGEVQINRDFISCTDGIYNVREDVFTLYKDVTNHNICTMKFLQFPMYPIYKSYMEGKPFQKMDTQTMGNIKSGGIPKEDILPNWDTELPTPQLDQIFSTQRFDFETRFWLLFYMGRLFFRISIDDNYQIGLLLRGVARSGKSLLIHIMTSFFPSNNVCMLESRREAIFGNEVLLDCFLWVMQELQEESGGKVSFCWAFWKMLIEGSEVSIPRKNLIAVKCKIDAHGITATNSSYLGDSSDQGSRDRRQATFGFYYIPDTIIADLAYRITNSPEIVSILRKCVIHYLYGREYIQNIYQGDIWKAMPMSVIRERQLTIMASNTMYQFIMQSSIARLGPECYVSVRTFANHMLMYMGTSDKRGTNKRNEEGLGSSAASLHIRTYHDVLHALHIKIARKICQIETFSLASVEKASSYTPPDQITQTYADPEIYTDDISFDIQKYCVEEVLIGINLMGRDPLRIVPCFIQRHMQHTDSNSLSVRHVQNAIEIYQFRHFPNETEFLFTLSYLHACLNVRKFTYTDVDGEYVNAIFVNL